MEKRIRIESATVVLPANEVDTDQIVPARFLTATSREGLGAALFHDLRRDARGALLPDFPLNRPDAAGAAILVAGANFGCGSSREHAPWALVEAGFRAVVSPSLADIFRENAARNGLVPVEVAAEAHARLTAAEGARVAVDVEAQTVTLPGGGEARFRLAPFARRCLLTGRTPLEFLLDRTDAVERYEAASGRAAPEGGKAGPA